MILAATFLLPFVMLGLVFVLAWIEERYLTSEEGSAETPISGASRGVTGPFPMRADPRLVVRMRPGRHRANAGVLAGRHPPGGRARPRRV
jgi:hypothetical protein